MNLNIFLTTFLYAPVNETCTDIRRNASQFWYTDFTACVLAKQLLSFDSNGCRSDFNGKNSNLSGHISETAIAVVSAPSVYIALRNLISETAIVPKPRLCLLEYDKRFEVLGPDFIFYDYQQPLTLPKSLKGVFDRIICDPPFLSEDCQTKTALTARFLAKRWTAPTSTSPDLDGAKFITCTGERMETLIAKLYGGIGVKTTTFEPEHSKGLSNEFRCYANFECDAWSWR
jgi:EEF1A lysine methyltransferase 1